MREYWMRSPWLRRLCIVLLAGSTWIMAGPAHAATANLSWVAPTTYTDGTPLQASAITGYNFRCGAGTTTGVSCTPVSTTGTATAAVMQVAVPATGGTACIEGQTVTAAAAGPYSIPPVCKTFPALQPGPPASITVAVVLGMLQAPVYSVRSSGALSTLVGFVDVGKPCGAAITTYRGATFREVTRADVLWWGSTSLRVAAPCGEG
jgi:hypothetical protein